MRTDHLALVRALAETLDTVSTDGLPAPIGAPAARVVALHRG